MSNLINRRGRDERRALLRACRRHVESGGVMLIQRYDPRSGLDPAARQTDAISTEPTAKEMTQ